MARITYEQGIKCRKCGKIITSIKRFQKVVLCQGCGKYLGDFDLNERELTVNDNADIITLKVTHNFFSNIYEECEKIIL